MSEKLLQCGRRSCSHVLWESERDWSPNGIGKTAICPNCGETGFYTLNSAGQKLTMSQHRAGHDVFDPAIIEPSPRMGPKMRSAILDAKRRALNGKETQDNA